MKQSFNKLFHRFAHISTHHLWGYPIFGIIIFIMFQLTFSLGQIPQEWIELGIEWLGTTLDTMVPEGMLKSLLLDGIISGVGGVLVFLPNILILFFCITFLEESGYMSRATILMNKSLSFFGMHGSSFVPLIMGFGCNVPAIMATNLIPNRKARLITIFITPLMSCSARLPVYILLVGTFATKNAGVVLFAIYAIGIIIGLLTALFLNKVMKNENNTANKIVIEPYKIPSLNYMLKFTWGKAVEYLKKMGGVVLIGSIVVWFLGYFPHQGESNKENIENSYIAQIGKAMEPVIAPLGFDWKIGVSLLTGATAKEVIISTMGVLYADSHSSTTLTEKLAIYPLKARLSLIAFVLLYLPCLASLIAIKKESGSWVWAASSLVYTTTLAWLVAFIIQIL